MVEFITDSWSILQMQSYNTRAQKMVGHNTLQNWCLHDQHRYTTQF